MLGLVTGVVTLPWAIGAGIAAWITSVILHLRDPKLVGSLLAPQFDRDLTVLDEEHLRYMASALAARDRLGDATRDLPGDTGIAGMKVRVDDVCRQLYDSVLWSQKADEFLDTVGAQGLDQRLAAIDSQSPVAAELREQLEVVETVRRRRNETLAQVASTITGIDTLAVKTAGLALGAPGSGAEQRASEQVKVLREDLDSYLDGLVEIERSLRESLPAG